MRVARLLVSAFLPLLVLMGVLAAGAPAARADGGPLRLTVAQPDEKIVEGRPVPLRFRLTNTGPTPCRVAVLAEGALAITSVRRDGEPVQPRITAAYYNRPLPGMRARAMATLPPGGSAALDATGPSLYGEVTVPSVSWSQHGPYLTTLWPVDRRGKYEMTARWTPPPGETSGCATPSGDVVARFTVTGDRWWENTGVPLVPLAAAGAAAAGLLMLVVLLLLLSAARRRRRRRRHWHPGPFGAGVFVAALVVSIVGLTGRPAEAKIDIQGSGSFEAEVNGCFAKFAASGDPAGVYTRVKNSKRTVRIKERPYIRSNPNISSSRTAPDNIKNGTLGKNGRPGPGTGSTVEWDPNETEPFDDQVVPEKCSTLYHELSHADDYARGADNPASCGRRPGDDMVAEIKATINENLYRATQPGLKPRTAYSGNNTLPNGLGECKKPRTPPKKGAKERRNCSRTSCGSNNGDPHLRTFDQRYYDLQSVGEFVMARSGDGTLEVQARHSPFPGSRTVAVVSAVAVKAGQNRVGIHRNPGGSPQVTVNGTTASLRAGDVTLPGGTVLYGEDLPDGSGRRTVGVVVGETEIRVAPIEGWGLDVQIAPAESLRNRLSGILGNFNGNPADDLVIRGGRSLGAQPSAKDVHREYADSWRVTGTTSLFDYGPGQSTRTFTDRSFPDLDAPGPSRAALEAAEQICRNAGVTDPVALRECAYDVAVTGQRAFADAAARRAEGTATAPGEGTAVPVGAQRPLPAPGATLLFAGTVEQPGQRHEYRLDGTAGQIVYFDGLDTCPADPNAGTLRYTVYGPSGAYGQVAYLRTCQDAGRIVLKETGTHRLVVYGDPGVSGAYRARILGVRADRAIPASVGGTLAGTLDMPGANDVHTFTGTAGQTVMFDGLDTCPADPNAGTLRYTMYAPSGAYGAVAYVRTCQDTAKITLNENGPHRVVVYGDALTTGAYRVRLTP
ncbi:hypothetical protein DPM19_02400 [Actinomadura craniellae]|uniref:VWFD domain-containing protein n=1 Tax=Actinomadura craniellae TaxID=2231787 RepID=A0A365HD27_9ACTN|nr:VWD domain-containing protein [Actinomadura craniellae]RAY17034.1 hypothetical protein DPM19_02400 [Actinomadura craniellae]